MFSLLKLNATNSRGYVQSYGFHNALLLHFRMFSAFHTVKSCQKIDMQLYPITQTSQSLYFL